MYAAPADSVDNTFLSKAVAYPILLFSVLVLPGLYIWLIFKKRFELRKRKTFRRKWLTLYENLNVTSKVNLLYNVFFVFRRMAYV